MSRKLAGGGGSLLAGLALVLCCGLLPLLLASGVLAVAGGWLSRAWPLVVVGFLVLGYAAVRIRRLIRDRDAKEVGSPVESRRR